MNVRSLLRALLSVVALSVLLGQSPVHAQTVVRYSFSDGTILPTVLDESPAGNDGTAGPLAALSPEIPFDGIPADAGDLSLDSSDPTAVQASPSGVVTTNTLILSNASIAAAGGFTMECWFQWNGGGTVNSLIDYAGTEKLVIDIRGGAPGLITMRIAGTGDTPIGFASVGEWHYVAAVFDTGGAPLNADGTISGTLSVYLDGLLPRLVVPDALKDNFGDSLVRGIGFGQHPLGFPADFFDGLIFEPRVSLGALAASELLLDADVPPAAAPVFHYQFSNATPLPSVPDASSAGNDATAVAGAALSTDIPEFRPAGAGNRSLATATAGALTNATSLLANPSLESRGGFSMECWFRWDGGGSFNAILEYAGTEGLVIDTAGAQPGLVEFIMNGADRYPVGTAIPGTWHYVAVVFNTGATALGGDGSLTGNLVTYFDGADPDSVSLATKSTSGDDADLEIGVGQSALGAAGTALDGAVFEPRVVAGALQSTDLSFVPPVYEPGPVFRYTFDDDTELPEILDASPAGNDALAGPLAFLSGEIPVDGVPADAGDLSLDTSDPAAVQGSGSGAVTNGVLFLANDRIAQTGGFTMECWFQWNGGGTVNSIIDYAGTEKIVLDTRGGTPGLLEMLISGTGRIPIGVVTPLEWHYVAVVFDTEGGAQNADGTINGTVRVYLDTLRVATSVAALKDNFGDSLERGIGVGQHPVGFDLDYFDGFVFEPRVSLGALSAEELLLEGTVLEQPEPRFAYSFFSDTPLPSVPDQSAAGNDATAGAQAALSTDVPSAVPAMAGDRSLDSSGGAGAVTDAVDLLANTEIVAYGGFTLETWFRWDGGGMQNSILDYAGTERILIDTSSGTPGLVELAFDGAPRIPLGEASAGEWHYVAVVYDTGGAAANGDGSVDGSVTAYFDGLASPVTRDDVRKSTTGDARNQGVGIGQAPGGAAASVLDGKVFEPKLTIGPLAAAELSFVAPLPPPESVFRYSFLDDPAFPGSTVSDEEGPGNDALAGPVAALSTDIPEDGVPSDAGEVSLDASGDETLGATGLVTLNTLLLTNDLIETAGGFTFESWFQWFGGGTVNSVIDYAGTEKIVVQNDDGLGGRLIEMVVNDSAIRIPFGSAVVGEWHYVAVVFSTGGASRQLDGSIPGTMTFYLDGNEPVLTVEDVSKSTFGDSLARSIGVGQHPNGFVADFFDGLIFEPRVTLGPLSGDELLYGGGGPGGIGPFLRGDCDGDGNRNITDGVFLLNYLFLGGTRPPCLAACDNDGSGAVPATPTDALNLFNFLFLGGAPLPEPLDNCGTSTRPEDARVGCADARGCV